MVSKWWAWLSLLSLTVGCSQDITPLTQLILVADTDIQNVDQVQFEISSATENRSASAAHTPGGVPSYVSLVHDHGTLGPITVTARGLHAGAVLVTRTERVYFVEEQSRVVPLHLLASCLNVVCAANQTCGESGCMSEDVAQSELPTWSGQPPHLVASVADAGTSSDAGPMDGGADASRPDASNMMMDAGRDGAVMDATVITHPPDAATDFVQCNGMGPLVDLQTDMANCGMCGMRCSGGRTCLAGICVKK